MDCEIIWAEPAADALEGIVRHLAQHSESAAEGVRSSILNHVENLARFPFIGPVYERDRSGRTREIVCGSYRIFYRVDETTKRVLILTVWHAARNEPDLPS